MRRKRERFERYNGFERLSPFKVDPLYVRELPGCAFRDSVTVWLNGPATARQEWPGIRASDEKDLPVQADWI